MFVSTVMVVNVGLHIVQLVLLAVLQSSMIAPGGALGRMIEFMLSAKIFTGILGVVIGCLFAWFALQYGRQIKVCLDTMDPPRLEDALQWQKRYWALQSVVFILTVVLVIAGAIVGAVLGASMAPRGG
ncbi:MAG: hypothetical protein L0I62_01800 [Gammaproteobacteria bacterium]|nr:hypothetical protein [Gammaproteobacteria bacterium]